jgi:hypothetical protein
MTRPRPSRKARWAIGLSFVGLFTLITLGATMVALGQALSGLGGSTASASTGDPADDGWADSTTTAVILDVDVYNLDDEKVSRFFDREDGEAGYAEVDIEFRNNGTAVDGDQISVTWMAWPDELPLPEAGDKVDIGYHSNDPENDPQLADSGPDAAKVGVVVAPLTSAPLTSAPQAGGPDLNDPSAGVEVSTATRWTIVISGTLAIVSLLGTLIWARRADTSDREANTPIRPNEGGWGRAALIQAGPVPGGWNQPPPPPTPRTDWNQPPPPSGLTPPG